MPYFKRMSFRIPSEEYWLLRAWGLNIRGDALDAVTQSGTAYRYRCTGPIESSFYEGGKQCIAYRYIQKDLVVQIIFKTKRVEDAGAVLEQFERDLEMILSELEWTQG